MQQGEETVELQVSVESLKYGLMLQPLEETLLCPNISAGSEICGAGRVMQRPMKCFYFLFT